jgi:hypothetical protein
MKKIFVAAAIIIPLLALLAVLQIVLFKRDRDLVIRQMREEKTELKKGLEPELTVDRMALRIVSDAPGAPPIQGATVAGAGPSGPIRVVTEADGIALIPRGTSAWLRITAPRHVGTRRKFDLVESEQTFVMKRVGAARFTVTGIDGKPVEGLKIRLSPSGSAPDMEVPHPKEQASDESGIVQWDELLPDTNIGWTCTSGHPLEPGEGVKTGGNTLQQDEEGRWSMHSPGTAFQSGGSFIVGPGEVYKLELRVRRTGSIRAKLGSGPQAAGRIRVQVWNKAELPSPAGTFKDYSVERSLEVDPGATFEVPNLTPGAKDIRAWWWDEPGRRVFARMSFTLEGGDKRDLGTLSPVPGTSVEMLVRVEAPPEILDRIIRPAQARISFSASVPGNDDLSVADILEVEVDKPFVLAGLHANRIFINCDPQITRKPGPSAVKFKGPGQLDLPLPPPGRIEIVLKGEAEHLVQVNFTFPPLATKNQFDAVLIPVGAGPVCRIGGGTPMAGTKSYQVQGFVPPGEYEVWVCSRGELNLFARTSHTVRAEGGNVVNLGDLGPGAVIRGRAVTKSGKPYKYPVFFGLADRAASGDRNLYYGPTDAEGRFVITGIVPGTRLVPALFEGAPITAGAAGTETWVDLVGSR